jgi:hypothetical protein
MITHLLQDYRKYAFAHGEAIRACNSKKANKAHDALWEVLKRIVASGCDSELFGLYEDEDPDVQSWAAAHTLEIDEKKATAKLQELVDAQIENVSWNSKYALAEWKKGNLRFRERM